MLRGIILAAAFAPISLAFNFLVILTSPLWALLAASLKLTVLPWPLSWVHTHDNPIYGLGGTPATFTGRFKAALWWLVRNPGYGFDAYVLGYDHADLINITTRQSGRFGGSELAWALSDITFSKGRRRFLLRADVPLLARRYAKFWIGWHVTSQAGRHMFKVDFNPFKRARYVRLPHTERY